MNKQIRAEAIGVSACFVGAVFYVWMLHLFGLPFFLISILLVFGVLTHMDKRS
jgi:hypothetical protein